MSSAPIFMKEQPTISMDMPAGAAYAPVEHTALHSEQADHPRQSMPMTATEALGQESVVRHTVQRERLIPAQDRMEGTFKIPVVATIVFVITMIAIFYLGRIVAGYYEPVMNDGRVEFVGRSS